MTGGRGKKERVPTYLPSTYGEVLPYAMASAENEREREGMDGKRRLTKLTN